MGRTLPDWISAYVEHTKHLEAPEQFHFWTAVSTIAGALRRKVCLPMGYWKWYPNFFILLVAPPGIVSKSTAINIGMSMLKELPYIKFGPAVASWQAFVSFMANCRVDMPQEDGTFTPMCAATVEVSELGTFLDPRNQEQLNVLTDLWDGREVVWEKITKGAGCDQIINPWINLVGCTTPSWIAENTSSGFAEGGFASRVMFVYAEKKREFVAYPHLSIPMEFTEQHEMLVEELDHIAGLAGEFKLTDDALVWGDSWYREHSRKMEENDYPHLAGNRFKFYLARKQTHLHKLAMILSASCRDDLCITDEDLIRAEQHLNETEESLPEIFRYVDREEDSIIASNIEALVTTLGEPLKMDLYRQYFFQQIGWETFERGINSLIHGGLIRQIQDESGKARIKLRRD